MARRGNDSTVVTAALLGALSGMRSMAAPRLVARALEDDRRAPAGSGLLSLAAAGEMLADKTPWIPDRVSPLALTGRVVLGAASAAVYARHRNQPVLIHGAVAAAAAVMSTVAAYHLRRQAAERLDLPDVVVALLEDAVVLGAGRLWRRYQV